jgi:hypothetical protein
MSAVLIASYALIGILIATVIIGKQIKLAADDNDYFSVGLVFMIWLIVIFIWPLFIASAIFLGVIFVMGKLITEIVS